MPRWLYEIKLFSKLLSNGKLLKGNHLVTVTLCWADLKETAVYTQSLTS